MPKRWAKVYQNRKGKGGSRILNVRYWLIEKLHQYCQVAHLFQIRWGNLYSVPTTWSGGSNVIFPSCHRLYISFVARPCFLSSIIHNYHPLCCPTTLCSPSWPHLRQYSLPQLQKQLAKVKVQPHSALTQRLPAHPTHTRNLLYRCW